MDKLTDYLNLIKKNKQRGGALTNVQRIALKAFETLAAKSPLSLMSGSSSDYSIMYKKVLADNISSSTPEDESELKKALLIRFGTGTSESDAKKILDAKIKELEDLGGSTSTSTSTSGAPSATASSLTPPGGAPSLSSTGGPSPPPSSSSSLTPPSASVVASSLAPPPPPVVASTLAPPPPVVASSLAPPPLAPPSSSSALTPPPSTGGPSPPPIVAPSTAVASSISKVLRPSLIDYGDPEFSSYNVRVYKSTGNRGDTLLGSTVASSGQTIKSVLDSIKGAGVSQRCIVTSHHNFVNSIGPKDYYVSFNNLRLRNGNVELFLI
jgi:hypothetical protein